MGLGLNEYTAVPPPPAQVYSPPKNDLSWTGLSQFVDVTVTDYSRPTPSIDVLKDVSDQKAIWKRNCASSSEQVGSFDNVVSKPMIRFVKETSCPSVSKVNNTKNSRKPTVKYAEMYRNTSQNPKVMSSNFGPPIIEDWDSENESEVNFTLNKTVRPSSEQVKFDKSTREVLGKDFVMQNKACYNCGSFEHLKFDCKQNTWVNKGKTWRRVDHDHDNMKYPSTPKLTSFVKTAHSHVKRPFVRKTAVKNKVWVPTARTKFPTVGSKVSTTKPTVVAVKGNRGKAVKASACWIWKPKRNQPEQGSNLNGVSVIFKKYKYIDTQGRPKSVMAWDSGCSRHMTGNISYLSEYEPYNGGYVSFGHGGGMITGCQFLGRRLISWQCKKQTIMATSITEAEYVAAASGYGQVLWIQNQLLDYGYNFMNTKIYIDNNSAICIVKNPVYHSKTKHIEIRHHFIRDCYEKKLINVDHIHTDDNVADLLTKAFDVGRFQYLVDEHVMMSTLNTMEKLAFCDYHNMVAILEKTESNTDFYQIVNFFEASYLRYALTVHPTVYVSYIQQFWSTARVEIVDGETKIIAKVNGRRLTKGAIRISQSKASIPGADETASPSRDDRHGEAFPIATSLDAGQDRETLLSPLPCLMKHHQRLLFLVVGVDPGEDLMTGDVEKSTRKGSDNTDEAANVLSTLEAANVLSSGSFPTAAPDGVATVSGSFPTAAIFTTASVTSPYTRRTRASRGIIIEPSHTTSVPTISTKGKWKEKMVESIGTKKKKIQEQLDAQVDKELEMEFSREEQLIREQGERDGEIARAQAEKELGMMIAKLNRSNELITKYMIEYEQAEANLSLEEKMKLITKLIKYQRNLAEIKNYQAQQSNPPTEIEKRNFYMAVLKIWKQLQDFMPMNYKTESKRVKRPGIQLAQERSKRLKTAKALGSEPSQEHQTKDSKELSEEELKKMMEIVPVKEVCIEALQAKYPIIEWEIYSEEQRKY
ncbi:putative ribonuclease H-like domain-containing protein [Tanacetum coccineum]|uniref:Ribonuclease H-like domain-containing protein n=1 Tax=Tanacetum coccineum TaxID=301880 RepID=A0ABQ4Y7A9_9ASTR